MNSIRVSNRLDHDLAQYVGPDLVPNCLLRLSVERTSSERGTAYEI